MFPHVLYLPSSTCGLLDSAGPLFWRLIQSSLSSQPAAVSFSKLLSTEGVGRLGPTKVKVEERDSLLPLEVPLVVWVNCGDREMCSRIAQPEALCAVLGVGTARFCAGAYAEEGEARLSIPSCGGCIWVSCF